MLLSDGIVPLSMKRFRVMTESLQFGVAHLDAFGIVIGVEGGAHFETGPGRRGLNQIDDNLVVDEWTPTPVQADSAE